MQWTSDDAPGAPYAAQGCQTGPTGIGPTMTLRSKYLPVKVSFTKSSRSLPRRELWGSMHMPSWRLTLMCVDPDGRFLYVADADGCIGEYSLAMKMDEISGDVFTMPHALERLLLVALGETINHLVCVSFDGVGRVILAACGEPGEGPGKIVAAFLDVPPESGNRQLPRSCVRRMPDSSWGISAHAATRRVAVSSNAHRVALFRVCADQLVLETNHPCSELVGHTGNIPCVSFSPDGAYVISCSIDCTMRLWSVSSGHQLAVYLGNEPSWPNGYWGWYVQWVPFASVKRVSTADELFKRVAATGRDDSGSFANAVDMFRTMYGTSLSSVLAPPHEQATDHMLNALSNFGTSNSAFNIVPEVAVEGGGDVEALGSPPEVVDVGSGSESEGEDMVLEIRESVPDDAGLHPLDSHEPAAESYPWLGGGAGAGLPGRDLGAKVVSRVDTAAPGATSPARAAGPSESEAEREDQRDHGLLLLARRQSLVLVRASSMETLAHLRSIIPPEALVDRGALDYGADRLCLVRYLPELSLVIACLQNSGIIILVRIVRFSTEGREDQFAFVTESVLQRNPVVVGRFGHAMPHEAIVGFAVRQRPAERNALVDYEVHVLRMGGSLEHLRISRRHGSLPVDPTAVCI